jgi:two-component system chemotaxis response regulator CheB
VPDESVRLLVVDDSALYRLTIRNVLRDTPGITIVGVAQDGLDALRKVEELEPDLLTLDIQMPDMDGIEVLREINRRGLRTKALMVSSLTARGAEATTDALLEGAFDFILKPSGNAAEENRRLLQEALVGKIDAFRQAELGGTGRSSRAPAIAPEKGASRPVPAPPCRVVILGVSTGGPAALKKVLPALPADLRVPLLVVQHMPPGYTSALASRLDGLSALGVVEAEDGAVLRAGSIYIAPGGRQMKVERRDRRIIARITDDPPEHGCRPAVDYLLRSAVEVFRGGTLGVILTGMGRDGFEGCRLLKELGGHVFAQHPRGCAVYGMPKAIIDSDLADRVLPLGRVATAITAHLDKTTGRARRGPANHMETI